MIHAIIAVNSFMIKGMPNLKRNFAIVVVIVRTRSGAKIISIDRVIEVASRITRIVVITTRIVEISVTTLIITLLREVITTIVVVIPLRCLSSKNLWNSIELWCRQQGRLRLLVLSSTSLKRFSGRKRYSVILAIHEKFLVQQKAMKFIQCSGGNAKHDQVNERLVFIRNSIDSNSDEIMFRDRGTNDH